MIDSIGFSIILQSQGHVMGVVRLNNGFSQDNAHKAQGHDCFACAIPFPPFILFVLDKL
jgi:hypothetical protein